MRYTHACGILMSMKFRQFVDLQYRSFYTFFKYWIFNRHNDNRPEGRLGFHCRRLPAKEKKIIISVPPVSLWLILQYLTTRLPCEIRMPFHRGSARDTVS